MSIAPASHHASPDTPQAHRYWRSAAVIVFLLATADLVFACTYWHQLYALPPSRLVQNIASGLLGKQAFAGGMNTVVLGLLLQYAMMSAMVGTYYLLGRRFDGLRRHPWRYGALYGVLLYIVMNDIVLPLSEAPKTPFLMSWILSSMVMHVLIGLVSAHGACWAANHG
jgi:hypothetical protein